jgi:hypothetical protein
MSVRPKKRRDSVDSQESDDYRGWKEILKKGDKLYDYMRENFESMFDGESVMKHFEIRFEGTCDLGSEALTEKYGSEIQKELVPWIYNQEKLNSLFDKTNWKPFRDKYCFREMYMGYKYMFQFKNYFFQLGIEEECALDNCKYCENNENQIHFQLIICGWKEKDDDNFLQPHIYFPILPNNIMPERYWQVK